MVPDEKPSLESVSEFGSFRLEVGLSTYSADSVRSVSLGFWLLLAVCSPVSASSGLFVFLVVSLLLLVVFRLFRFCSILIDFWLIGSKTVCHLPKYRRYFSTSGVVYVQFCYQTSIV